MVDLGAVAALMQSSWSENREQPLLYSAEFLGSALAYPGASAELIAEQWESDELVAFGAAFPRTVHYGGSALRLALDSFITVASAHKGKGLGGRIWGDLALRARDAGCDGLITFTVEGDRMTSALPRYSAERALSTAKVLDIHYLARPLAVALGDPVTAVRTPAPIDVFLSCADRVGCKFARTWTAPEAEWQTAIRYGALSASLHAGERAGVLSGYIMQTSGTPASAVAIIDDILWDTLATEERQTLLRGYLQLAKQRGAELAVTPILHYADVAPFAALLFRRSKRLLHMYLTAFSERLALSELGCAYIDVF